jgi:FixJ family two-component response regulator
MKNEPTVFLVDADAPTRDAVRDLVYTMNLPCEAYTSGRDFLEAFDPSRPGCIVLEVRIPDINGLQIQERLAAERAVIPLVFLTTQTTVSIAVRAMRLGAVHFMEKPFREHELWDTVQEAISLDARRRRAAERREMIEGRLARLTPKEQQVLGMIAEGKSKQTIAAEVGISVRTVELRRSRLMKKLGLGSLVELVVFALGASNGHAESFCATEMSASVE